MAVGNWTTERCPSSASDGNSNRPLWLANIIKCLSAVPQRARTQPVHYPLKFNLFNRWHLTLVKVVLGGQLARTPLPPGLLIRGLNDLIWAITFTIAIDFDLKPIIAVGQMDRIIFCGSLKTMFKQLMRINFLLPGAAGVHRLRVMKHALFYLWVPQMLSITVQFVHFN